MLVNLNDNYKFNIVFNDFNSKVPNTKVYIFVTFLVSFSLSLSS